MKPSVEKIVKDIKNLKIQGARNIAKVALETLLFEIKTSRAKDVDVFHSNLLETMDALAGARPTEPMLRNNLENIRYYASDDLKNSVKNIRELRELLVGRGKELLKRIEKDGAKLIEYGAKLIPDGAVVMTHCHSSTVVGVLKRANEFGKNISVVCCETRPLYQGRITAKELAKEGIKITFIVDGAMNLFMKRSDLCIVGADAVTSRGDLINKVGTSTLAHIARFHDVSFYSASELSKYSPATMFGQLEKIEERDTKEIFEKPPKGVTVRNPAFDATAARYISGYITEAGVIPSQSFFALATEKLGIKLYE